LERIKRIYRHRRNEGGVLLGLCSGVGQHLGIDPIIVRLVFILLLVTQTAGLAVILVYLLFALFIPFAPEE